MSTIDENINIPATPSPEIPPPDERNIANPGALVTQVAFDLKMEVINGRLNNSNYLLIGVLVALAICFITLFFGYWQFAATSYNDYSQKVKELNDERWSILQDKVSSLEAKLETKSATTSGR